MKSHITNVMIFYFVFDFLEKEPFSSPTMNCTDLKEYTIHNTDDRLMNLMIHSIGYSAQHNPVIINYKRNKCKDWHKDIKDGEKRFIEEPKKVV